MIYNLVRKNGIPVLAYPASDDATPWTCSLVVKHSEDPMQTTLTLQSSLHIHGFDDKQTFTLRYDADNLVPGKTSLGLAAIPLPQDRLEPIMRQGSAQLKTLSLSLKAPCPIWYSHSVESISPKPGFEASFHQLLKLARATEIRILFDFNWLRKDNHTRFQRLISHSATLTGLPVDGNFTRRFRQADWTVFSPVEQPVFGENGDVLSIGELAVEQAGAEALPSYNEVSGKRCRPGESLSTCRSSLQPTSNTA
jgi:hypothetical protein